MPPKRNPKARPVPPAPTPRPPGVGKPRTKPAGPKNYVNPAGDFAIRRSKKPVKQPTAAEINEMKKAEFQRRNKFTNA